mmetsp:Transcript_37135/g.78773  ORF Transcript_37135/g.78773 Transcript_37135/m.78773 type:complete len:224 (-) Transcript_37135:367-1038(-)
MNKQNASTTRNSKKSGGRARATGSATSAKIAVCWAVLRRTAEEKKKKKKKKHPSLQFWMLLPDIPGIYRINSPHESKLVTDRQPCGGVDWVRRGQRLVWMPSSHPPIGLESPMRPHEKMPRTPGSPMGNCQHIHSVKSHSESRNFVEMMLPLVVGTCNSRLLPAREELKVYRRLSFRPKFERLRWGVGIGDSRTDCCYPAAVAAATAPPALQDQDNQIAAASA